MKLDLYEILGVLPSSSKKEIVKSYRKKALKCHPDKNPDNPKAAEEFHTLSKALEILTDEEAKEAYEKILNAKKKAQIRHRELDSKRKKLKEDLEARERAAADRPTSYVPDLTAAEALKKQIERLRKEGSKLLEEEQERLREELKQRHIEDNSPAANDDVEDDTKVAPRLKLKWKAKKGDETNGGYDRDILMKAFSKYGDIEALLVSTKKNGTAVVEFTYAHCAMLAIQQEIGLPENPLTVTWLCGEPIIRTPLTSVSQRTEESTVKTQSAEASGDRDFESLVMMKMRQAEERKKLIEEMQKEDDEEKT